MALLTRWNPFKQLSRFEPMSDFDELFRGFGMRQFNWDNETPLDLRMDVAEDDKAYTIKIDVPGVKKEDIEISIDGNRVSISAEVKRESKSEKGKEIHSERYCGKAFRSFTLADTVNEAKAEAKYDNGVLTLSLPKKPNGNAKKLEVH